MKNAVMRGDGRLFKILLKDLKDLIKDDGANQGNAVVNTLDFN